MSALDFHLNITLLEGLLKITEIFMSKMIIIHHFSNVAQFIACSNTSQFSIFIDPSFYSNILPSKVRIL